MEMLQKSIGSGKKYASHYRCFLSTSRCFHSTKKKNRISSSCLKSRVKTLFGDSFHLKISSSMKNLHPLKSISPPHTQKISEAFMKQKILVGIKNNEIEVIKLTARLNALPLDSSCSLLEIRRVLSTFFVCSLGFSYIMIKIYLQTQLYAHTKSLLSPRFFLFPPLLVFPFTRVICVHI